MALHVPLRLIFLVEPRVLNLDLPVKRRSTKSVNYIYKTYIKKTRRDETRKAKKHAHTRRSSLSSRSPLSDIPNPVTLTPSKKPNPESLNPPPPLQIPPLLLLPRRSKESTSRSKLRPRPRLRPIERSGYSKLNGACSSIALAEYWFGFGSRSEGVGVGEGEGVEEKEGEKENRESCTGG